MTEPAHTAVACGVAYASCYAIGADPAALVMALVGSVAATVWADELNNLRRTYGAVMLSTLFGGYGAPAVIAASDGYLKKHEYAVPVQTLEFLAPLVVGAGVVIILPHLGTLLEWGFKRLKTYLGDKIGGTPP